MKYKVMKTQNFSVNDKRNLQMYVSRRDSCFGCDIVNIVYSPAKLMI